MTGTRVLTQDESKHWQQKLANKTVSAKPLAFEKADLADAPFQISVTNGQAPGGKSLVIQLIKRPDVSAKRAIEVTQHALIDVFGPHAGAEAELDYIDAAELKKRTGVDKAFVTEHDSLSIIFRPGPIAATRRPKWVRDQMAVALRRWFDTSVNW